MQEMLNLEDRKDIQMFVNQANRLCSCNFFKEGKPKMALNLGEQLTNAIVPGRQDFIEMLTILRPFIMNDDRIFFNKIVIKIRNYVEDYEQIQISLNSIHDEFKFYKGEYDGNQKKYQRKYSNYISAFSDITCDLGNRTIFNILNLVMNGYYFHFDPKKQTEIANFIKEQKKSWLGTLKEEDLADESVIMIREQVREAFKFRFYRIAIDIANCVFNLKDLIIDFFGYPLDEELHQESQMLYDFLDI